MTPEWYLPRGGGAIGVSDIGISEFFSKYRNIGRKNRKYRNIGIENRKYRNNLKPLEKIMFYHSLVALKCITKYLLLFGI